MTKSGAETRRPHSQSILACGQPQASLFLSVISCCPGLQPFNNDMLLHGELFLDTLTVTPTCGILNNKTSYEP